MSRRAILLFALAACTPPTTQAPICASKAVEPAPVAVALPAEPECSADRVAKLYGAKTIHVLEHETGHAGIFDLRFDLTEYPALEDHGFSSISYLRTSEKPVTAEAREVVVDPHEIELLIYAFDRAMTVVDKNDARRVFIDDSSRTTHLMIDIQNGAERITFETDNAQTDPATWHLRGCARPIAHDAAPAIRAAVDAFKARVGFDELFTAARMRANP